MSALQAQQHNKDQHNTQQARLHGQHDVDAPAASVVTSAAKHLQAATLVQQLQLPEVRNQQQNPFSTLQDTTDSHNSAGAQLKPPSITNVSTVSHSWNQKQLLT